MSSPIGLAVPKFYNLPYLYWEMYAEKPENNETEVILKLNCQHFTLMFSISQSTVCLKSIQNVEPEIFSGIVGVYYKPMKLIRLLQRKGIGIFPANDTFIILDIQQKDWITENHIYQCMAMCSTTFHFTWSKWNYINTSKEIVCDLKEHYSYNHTLQFCTVYMTPERAVCVDVIEDVFPTIDILATQFYPDLYWLVQSISCAMTKKKIENISQSLVQTVSVMLSNIRFFSFST